ncbi:Fused toxin protein [Varanus komodoensis]|nr:Fused toxin protein [Varanus komodoensis]
MPPRAQTGAQGSRGTGVGWHQASGRDGFTHHGPDCPPEEGAGSGPITNPVDSFPQTFAISLLTLDCAMASKKCERFIYGGCDGNKNNFKTLKECRQTCVEKPGTCPSPWPGADRLCDVRCHSDWECPGPQKCCPYGCHVSCYDPI